MRLKKLKIAHAGGLGGLLNGLDVWMGRPDGPECNEHLTPLCVIGPNGSGKSQFLQLIAEIFQSAWNAYDSEVERRPSNTDALFELEYSVCLDGENNPVQVKLARYAKGKSVGPIEMSVLKNEEWQGLTVSSKDFAKHLPSVVIGYTSGDNETLSLPFMVSRAGYADAVATAALGQIDAAPPTDNRTLQIDYGTNLEVLFANLVLSSEEVRKSILEHARLKDIASCRCIVRLAHSAVRRAPAKAKRKSGRKGIQLTQELEEILNRLKRSATCWNEDEKTESYVFDFHVDSATRAAFKHFFKTSFELYRALHKFALLNDLAIPRVARKRLDKAVSERKFASRLPEPQQEDLVFGFEEVRFHSAKSNNAEVVDYVALSDGEHQQALILGLFSMIRDQNALFILDEPESHFNPQWRVQFAKRLLGLPGDRGEQEVLLTSHAPFVPADLSREQVLVFARDGDNIAVDNPQIETYGANFDRILEHCFDVRPPLSQLARDDIKDLLESDSIEDLEEAMDRLGSSVEKSFVADRLRQLKKAQAK
ncbi:MAG: restriction system-associated AAA family ATPase [Parasphingorhabdus sp.]